MTARWFCVVALVLGACSTGEGSSDGGPDGSLADVATDATNEPADATTDDATSEPVDATTDATNGADSALDATTDSVDDQATDAIDEQAQVSVDAAPDAPTATYNDFTVTTNWSSYDVTANVDASLHSYVGGTFDGRYVY